MGILDRFATIAKANINELLDHAEDPAKMIDQYLVDLTESLAEIKRETTFQDLGIDSLDTVEMLMNLGLPLRWKNGDYFSQMWHFKRL